MRHRTDDTEQTVTDVVSILTRDHQRARALLTAMADSSERAVQLRERALAELVDALRVHLILEEEFLDPAFLAASCTADDAVLLTQGRAVHDAAKHVFDQLERRNPKTTDFRALSIVLHDLVELHTRQEEETLFPRVRELIRPEALVDLGARLGPRRRSLEASFIVTRPWEELAWRPAEPDVCS